MIKLISVGRLSMEKWVHLLVAVLPELIEQYWSIFEFHFFGDWPLRHDVEQLADRYDTIHCHGHTPKNEIIPLWKKCHYTLMPSLFLETFGLTALDSLSLWVPVVWFKKGWLAQFLLDDWLVIPDEQSVWLVLSGLITWFNQDFWETLSKKACTQYHKYSREQWYKKFTQYSWLEKWARIALVSDYGVDIWGIENWLFLLQKKLRSEWYLVEFIGWINKKPSPLRRFIWLIFTLFNLWRGVYLRRKLRDFKPDLIWYHSIHRVFGPLPVWMNRNISAEKRIMYHDFGLFHPFPSKVYNSRQVVKAKNFLWYIVEWWRGNPLALPFYIVKYCQKVLLLWLISQQIDKYFVPSKYMESLVIDHGIPKNNLHTLPHFIHTIQ